MTIEELKHDKCFGCAACSNVCPVDAISMYPNEEGFLCPQINHDKCINCGKCHKVCPALNVEKDNEEIPSAYAVKFDDDFMSKSTSAGVFAKLAKKMIDDGGYVCGASYNEYFEVVHKIVNDEKGLEDLRKSKYVQSQIGMLFRQIKEYLEKGNKVLFSGTPCQVAGLKRYIGSENENLITVDIICHGVPSPKAWKQHLLQNIDISNLKFVDFRHKGDHGFKKLFIQYKYKDGTEVIKSSNEDLYYYHFLNDLGLRKTCYHCEYATFPRIGDISIGDWWGASSERPDLIESDKGISIAILNNSKGEKFFSSIKEDSQCLVPITASDAMKMNRAGVERRTNRKRGEFFKLLDSEGFNQAVKDCLKETYDVIICGATENVNYGGLVTYFALYKCIEKMGMTVAMMKGPLRDNMSEAEKDNHAVRFSSKYFNMTPAKRLNRYNEYNDMAETFLLGSDQIWNYKLFRGRKTTFYLDFVSDDKKKIAYAASYGFKHLTLDEFPEMYGQVTSALKKIDYISVRESDGVTISLEGFGENAVHVMDPVFLLPVEEYDLLANTAKHKPQPGYMTTYFLTPTEVNNEAIRYVSDKMNLPMVNMTTGNPGRYEKYRKMFVEPVCEDLDLEEWLYNIKNSDFVLTDSYHCTCFSIIFRKNFILIQDKWAPSRIESLMTRLGLLDRWIDSPERLYNNPEILKTNIDYDQVYKILSQDVFRSYNWLENAVKASKRVHVLKEIVQVGEKDSLKEAQTINEYWMALKNFKNIVLYLCNHGESIDNLRLIDFPSYMGIGKISKQKMERGFCEVVDIESSEVKKTFAPKALNVYEKCGRRYAIYSQNRKYADVKPISEFHYEDNSGKLIFECTKEGFYIGVFSTEEKRFLDIAVISKDERNGYLTHTEVE